MLGSLNNMYAKQKAIQEVITSLKKAIGKEFTVTQDALEIPPDPALGDIAFPCFEYAKGQKRTQGKLRESSRQRLAHLG